MYLNKKKSCLIKLRDFSWLLLGETYNIIDIVVRINLFQLVSQKKKKQINKTIYILLFFPTMTNDPMTK